MNSPRSFSRRNFIKSSTLVGCSILATVSCRSPAPTEVSQRFTNTSNSKPLKLGFNLWPGAIPWQIAEEKGFFQAHNIKAEIVWFQVLADQLAAFNAGKIDMANLTFGDLFAANSNGIPCKIILMPDVSAGADAIVVNPSIQSIQQFAGKSAGVEVATVAHLLFLKALESGGVKPESVEILNMASDAAISALIANRIKIAASYEPFVSQSVKSGKGKVIFSSKDVLGLFPDIIVMHQKTLNGRTEEVQKLVNIWHQVMDFRAKNPEEALAIEAKRASVSVVDYRTLLQGLQWLTPQQTLAAFQPGTTPQSAVYAGEEVAKFMVEQKLLKRKPSPTNELIDDRFLKAYIANATN